MTADFEYDVAVIGAGPGGYVAAIRAAQLGLSTVIIEKESVGGLCLNWGCIPSKALLHGADLITELRHSGEFGIAVGDMTLDFAVAVERSRRVVEQQVKGVETLLEQNGVELVRGTARLAGSHALLITPGDTTITAGDIIIATGARTRSLPNLPIDGHRVISSREALGLRNIPATMLVVGGGPVGVELAYLFRAYGAAVTLVETLPRLLPAEDEDVSRQLERSLSELSIELLVGTSVGDALVLPGAVQVQLSSSGTMRSLSTDLVLVAVGFEPGNDTVGLRDAGVALNRGYVEIDGYCCTNVPGVWAIGDVTGKLMLAHVASRQGVVVAETIAGLDPPALDYEQMPRACYCQPQVASIGLTEVEARKRGASVSTGRFPFRATGKAMAIGQTEGFVKVVLDSDSGAILGFHMIGPDVTELLGEAALGVTLEATGLEFSSAVHAHPTLSEALKEAVMGSAGESIHFHSPRRA
jgi:dihydrolipoamide dehydrogenase